MKNLRKLSGVALALLAGAPSAAWAQAVAIPAAPPPPAAAAGAPAPVAAAAPTKNLWTFLCPSDEQKAKCKAKFCGSQFGKLISNSLGPASALTGGVLPQPCPGPNGLNPANLALPPDSAAGAAAQVQKDAAEAAARSAAVRYLSTVDCNWWPEARAALINALRADKNECVRLEAALALQRGCCCNKDTIKALTLTVSGSQDDGNPAEDSPRVRAAAMAALEHCLACFVAIAPAPPPPPPPPPPKEGPPGEVPPVKGPPLTQPHPATPGRTPVAGAEPYIRPATHHEHVKDVSREQVIQEARRVLQKARQPRDSVAPLPAGNRGLSEVIEFALHPPAPRPTDITRFDPPPQAAAPGGTIAEAPISNWAPAQPASPAANPMATPAVIVASSRPVVSTPADSGGSLTVPQLLILLESSRYPDTREWAAKSLTSRGEPTPTVVQALVSGAVADASADVRLACLQGLLRFHVADPALPATVARLQVDGDPRVREAAKALNQWLQGRSAAPTTACP